MQIRRTPESTFQIFSGILETEASFFPKKLPVDKFISWKVATRIGNRNELYPIMLLQIPTQKESIESAIPRYKASFISIFFEQSKSDEIGLRIIWMVIPKNFIKKQ